MPTPEQIVTGLLRSPAGCDAILNIANNSNLPIEHFAQPRASFDLAAAAIRFCDIHQGIAAADLALRHGQTARETAEEISRNPSFAWWFAPVDLDSQIISKPYLNSLTRDGGDDPSTPPDPAGWRRPRDPHPEELPGTGRQRSSSLLDGTNSQWTAYAHGAADHISDFPIPAWRMRFHQEVRVFEVNHPADWHDLCEGYPAEGEDGRLLPDWFAVSADWDGVHLTLGGLLTCEQNRFEKDGRWSMHHFWHAESTYWLRSLKTSVERIEDVEAQPLSPEYEPYEYVGEWRQLVSGSSGFFALR